MDEGRAYVKVGGMREGLESCRWKKGGTTVV